MCGIKAITYNLSLHKYFECSYIIVFYEGITANLAIPHLLISYCILGKTIYLIMSDLYQY